MILEAQNLVVGYSRRYPTQSHISFTLESGDICCVLGPNGCGKTTLFRSILGLMPLLGGRVLIDSNDISKWSAKRLSRAVSYVSQGYSAKFPYPVKDIVLLGRLNRSGFFGQPSEDDYRAAQQAMVDLGIYHLRDKLYTDISGGELQLVMIARALVQNPKIIVMDEPTASLDYGNAVRVITHIKGLAQKGYGILMTTHSPDHAFMCDSHVLLLQRDFPMRYGRAEDIITEKNMRQALGVNIKVVEFVNERNRITRRCSPVF